MRNNIGSKPQNNNSVQRCQLYFSHISRLENNILKKVILYFGFNILIVESTRYSILASFTYMTFCNNFFLVHEEYLLYVPSIEALI